MGLIIERKAPTVVEQIMSANTGCLNQMKMTAKQTFVLLWKNKDLTPQQVCDALGADAAAGFDAHLALQGLIYLLDNSWAPLVPANEYTKNKDGTVSITPLPEPKPEPIIKGE